MSRRRAALLILWLAAAALAVAQARWLEAGFLLWRLAQGAPPDAVAREIGPEGDLYASGKAPRAGIVLLPGVSPDGKDDARLVRFAQALATARFRVFVPELPEVRALRVSASDSAALVEAVRALRRDGLRVGLGAFSYAVGPAVLAALELGPEAAFVLAVGGYHDLTRIVAHFTAGPADPRAKWLFVRANASRLPAPEERQALTVIANRKLADPGAAIGDLLGDLGRDGRAVLALVDNGDPAQVARLIDALPAAVREELVALDLARRDLSRLTAPLLLIHGRNDPVAPAQESVSLAGAAREARLFVLEDLHHVDAGWTLRDGLTMLRAAHALLSLRDGAGFR
jgi:pimeloyl-ACP methyl ester carboxylesterase